jgi:uracil-DNA glycosylase family 4
VSGYGDENATIMFVGLAPGRNGADITGVPFTRDPSGILFQEAMIKAGFSLENDPTFEKPKLKHVFITNIVKCNPKDEKGNNRHPSKDEINNCVKYFEIEKQLIKPNIIVLLGKTTTEHILNIKIGQFIQLHNNPIYKDSIIYVPFLHPSYIIRGMYQREKYLQEILNISGLVK